MVLFFVSLGTLIIGAFGGFFYGKNKSAITTVVKDASTTINDIKKV